MAAKNTYSTKSTRLQARQLSKMHPEDFTEQFVCVWFVEDMTYDIVPEKIIERTAKAKSKSEKIVEGEIVQVRGHLSKIMRIGTRIGCDKELKTLEKAIDVITERKKETHRKRRLSSESSVDSDNDETPHSGRESSIKIKKEPEDLECHLEEEKRKIDVMLKARKLPEKKPVESFIFEEEKTKKHENELIKLKDHVTEVDNKLDAILSILNNKDRDPDKETPDKLKQQPKVLSSCSTANDSPTVPTAPKESIQPVMYNGINLTTGHIPSKPALFATQKLSTLFTIEELQTNTIEPTKKSGKGELDPQKLEIIFDALNKVYGERKIFKTKDLIVTAIKQKCLDQVKAKKRLSIAESS